MKLAIATVDLILAFLAVANLSGCHPVVAEPAAFVITESETRAPISDIPETPEFPEAENGTEAEIDARWKTQEFSPARDENIGETDSKTSPTRAACPCGKGCPCGEDCPCRKERLPEQAGEGEPVVKAEPIGAYFYAPWCGPCQRTSPIVEALQAEGLAIEAINFDERPDLARHYGITALPAFVRYGSPYSTRWVGAYGREQIAAMFGHSIDTSPRSVERLDTSGQVQGNSNAYLRVKAGNGLGSGVVVGPGQVLTNSHVVRGGCPHAVEIAGQWRAARGPVPWVPPEATAHKSVAERGDLDTGATAHFYER